MILYQLSQLYQVCEMVRFVTRDAWPENVRVSRTALRCGTKTLDIIVQSLHVFAQTLFDVIRDWRSDGESRVEGEADALAAHAIPALLYVIAHKGIDDTPRGPHRAASE